MKKLLSTEEAAEYLGVTPKTLNSNRAKWGIPLCKVGRLHKYDIEDLNKYIQEAKQ